MKRLAVLGSTGSVGRTTLALVERYPDRFSVAALAAAGRSLGRLREQALRFRPGLVGVADALAAAELDRTLRAEGIRVVGGPEGLAEVATVPGADMVVSAIVGAAGLIPTLEAVRAGRAVALANKEALVVAGELITREARARGAPILAVDSEHNAVFQLLGRYGREGVRRVVLTASGGPFFRRTGTLEDVTPSEALRHPTWKMGDKITIDSATLMNKGLEVIEARWLFDLPPEKIGVLIHPQSIVHSLVEFADGSVMAQMAIPDMTIPIASALAHPERLDLGYLPPLNLPGDGPLEFFAPDPARFPCLGLAYRALDLGGTAPAALSAANEVAVERFLLGAIRFTDIPRVIGEVLDRQTVRSCDDLQAVLAGDRDARAAALACCEQMAGGTGASPHCTRG